MTPLEDQIACVRGEIENLRRALVWGLDDSARRKTEDKIESLQAVAEALEKLAADERLI